MSGGCALIYLRVSGYTPPHIDGAKTEIARGAVELQILKDLLE
jgi:hypothetical protein